jgi:hypothetical protein
MSGIYVPGAFSKKKVTVEIPAVVSIEEKKVQDDLPKEPELKEEKVIKPVKQAILEIKPVEVKQSAWGGKKSFVECLKTNNSVVEQKEEPIIIKKSNTPVYIQKEIKKEDFDKFMFKYDTKLRKLYEKCIYYEKEYFSKLRINGEQGYTTFCKFMFYIV